MSVTSDGLFGAVVQTVTANTDWANLPNTLIDDASFARADFVATGLTETLQFSQPVAGSEIPAGDVITNIQITALLSLEAAIGTIDGVAIAGGNAKSAAWTNGIATFSGDLDYWGITQQQAQDFAAGTGDLTLFGTVTSALGNLYISWAKAQFTHEQTLIRLPAVF